MLAGPVLGSRTWMCTIAAPALAASTADAAICSGVTGTAGFFPTLSADPVTAHEIITLRDTLSSLKFVPISLQRAAGSGYGICAHGTPGSPCHPLCAALSLHHLFQRRIRTKTCRFFRTESAS